MQAAMTMNTVALGGIARPTARVAAKKSVTFGAPVAPKSATGFSVRRSVKPATVAMAADAEPIMEAPMKGIMDDMKARAPLYIDDFKQGISTKSLVRAPRFLLDRWITFVFIARAKATPRAARALHAACPHPHPRVRRATNRSFVSFFRAPSRARDAKRASPPSPRRHPFQTRLLHVCEPGAFQRPSWRRHAPRG
jgi:hypothetical protein